MSTYFCILTNVGAAKLANATALGQTLSLSKMALGDGGGSLPTPDQAQTSLVNEVRRELLNSVTIDDDNPNWIVCEQVIPADEGGWTIRETGLYDEDGDLVAVGNFPETYKPVLEEGSGRTQTIRMVIQVSNAATVTLKIDPAVVLATREYVDLKDAAHVEAEDPHTQYQTKVLAASQAAAEKVYVDDLQNKKRLFTVSGDADNIVLISKSGETPITTLNDFDEFSFIVTATNTSSSMTIKIDELDAVSLSGISSNTQIFETALLTVRYIGGAFYIAEQINPKTGNSVADIAKLITDTTDVLCPGEYALDGSVISSSDHPIACAKAAASSNYIEQATKDSDPIEYGGFYGFVDELDGSTTVTLPMVGGEFIRMFDDGRGVDSGRGFGSWQNATSIFHGTTSSNFYPGGVWSDQLRPRSSGENLIETILSATGGGLSRNSVDVVMKREWDARTRSIAYYGKTRL
ncbi:phage tail protein [Methylophaga sp.]|uniref:phage tail protein n=1 Tax=Methylophaga sp. TaxID=2024840 RepID=UPI003A948E2D